MLSKPYFFIRGSITFGAQLSSVSMHIMLVLILYIIATVSLLQFVSIAQQSSSDWTVAHELSPFLFLAEFAVYRKFATCFRLFGVLQ